MEDKIEMLILTGQLSSVYGWPYYTFSRLKRPPVGKTLKK
jgi:hypothetical protein